MKIFCITQARMGSKRLANKVLRTVRQRPLIDFHLVRLERSQSIDKILVAASDTEQDKALHDYLNSINQAYYAGEEQNVLKRFFDCATQYNISPNDLIIRVTSDCPLICPELIDQLVENYLASGSDYGRIDTDSFPRGVDAEIFSMAMLTEARQQATEEYQREHVTPYFYQSDSSYNQYKLLNEQASHSHYRLCVDEEADFALCKHLIEHFKEDLVSTSYDALIAFLGRHPEVSCLNQEVEQKLCLD